MSVSELCDQQDQSRELTASERVWSGPIFAVDADLLRLRPQDEPVARQVVLHNNAVAVVALREGKASSQADGAPEVLMICQYRHPMRARLWEIPAGLQDLVGEEPVRTAQRELAEETDLGAKQWDVLVDLYASPGFTTESVRVFLARDLFELPSAERSEREAEEAEFVPTWVSLEEAVRAALEGRLHNCSTVAGLLAADRARTHGFQGLRAVDAPWLRSPVAFGR
ncbi:NUDIX domain-containing protein [Actinomyces trachealis]|uniref:NUDIX domain-containing protein n=1 Tax=Actinomyces trachealis TaxID=2763540 RepID=UPI0018C6447E|nr:NUDIX hydrolase [Actinomyces trachealis]